MIGPVQKQNLTPLADIKEGEKGETTGLVSP